MKSKLFSPQHEVKAQDPLGAPKAARDEARFANAQAVPTSCATFSADDPNSVPTTAYRSK